MFFKIENMILSRLENDDRQIQTSIDSFKEERIIQFITR